MTVTIHSTDPVAAPDEIVARWQKVPPAVAVDLDHQTVEIDPAIRPLCPPGSQPVLFGRAVTARCAPPDFGAVLYAADLIGPGDILVIAADGNRHTAMIGEIISGYIRQRGGAGIVCDGAIRDVAEIAAWPDFPVFSRWITPRGPSSGDLGAVNGPVTVGGRLIQPGDLLIGDGDGLVALSPQFMIERIGDAEAKLKLEDVWQRSLKGGRSVAETFDLPPADQSA